MKKPQSKPTAKPTPKPAARPAAKKSIDPKALAQGLVIFKNDVER